MGGGGKMVSVAGVDVPRGGLGSSPGAVYTWVRLMHQYKGVTLDVQYLLIRRSYPIRNTRLYYTPATLGVSVIMMSSAGHVS